MLLEKAHNEIVFSLDDKVLRQVSKKKTKTRLWIKLKIFYMTKSFTSADKLNKCGYFKFTNAVIEPHLINTHL